MSSSSSQPPTTLPVSSHPTRSRTQSDLIVRSPRLLHHRTQTGRIERARSTSSRLLSVRNQEAIWETATGRSWAHIIQPLSSPEQSLPEFVTPLQLSEIGNYTAASSSASLPSLEALLPLEEETNRAGRPITPGGTDIPIPRECSSMEFMMPPQYPHYGSYPSSQYSSYLEQPYSGAEQERSHAHSSPQPSSYAPSYTTSPAIVGSSPALSRSGSTEREGASSYPYAARSSYGTASTSAQGYPYAATQGGQYGSTYPTSNDPYGSSNTYGLGYGPPVPSGYQSTPASTYGSQYAPGGSYDLALQTGAEDPTGVRVVNSRPKPQCWDHGCNGRQFSTFSNLLRHQRERSGASQKSTCPRCGAVFTRTTARNGHMAHDKCKRKSTTSTSEAE